MTGTTRPASWGPTPRQVPGYAQAATAGLVPRVPPTPPHLLAGRTAKQEFTRFLMKAGGVVVGLLVLLQVLPATLPTAIASLLLLVGGLGAFWLVFVRFWGAVGQRSIAECHAGYTTFVLTFGSFGWGEGRRWEGVGRRPPWDYSGVWVLDGDGRTVVSPPSPEHDAPGFYPSPNRPGRLELWTGAVWAGRYRG